MAKKTRPGLARGRGCRCPPRPGEAGPKARLKRLFGERGGKVAHPKDNPCSKNSEYCSQEDNLQK